MYVLPCVSVVTMGYHVIHLMYVLVINLRVPPMNLCIGVVSVSKPADLGYGVPNYASKEDGNRRHGTLCFT